MARPKRLMTAAATFTFALGIGFVMQYGDAIAARFLSEDEAEVPLTAAQAEEIAALGAVDANVATLPSDATIVAIIGDAEVAAPAAPIEEPVLMAAVNDAEIDAPVFDTGDIQAEPSCDTTMSATAMPYAMVKITVETPCYANETFVLHHQGMMFTASTSDAGVYSEVIPALSQDAFFIAAFDNGEGAIAQTDVPDLGNFDRAVLQWQGERNMFMHAREFGAGYGETGHITWESSTNGDMDSLANGDGGYLHLFGNSQSENALMVEIYSFPSADAIVDGDVLLSAEVEITAGNCGREITAQSLQIIPGSDNLANDLVMKMPDCDAIGEFLVLNNMFQDLTLASR